MANEPPNDAAPPIQGDALQALVAELRAIAEDERSVDDRRHVAEHAIAALIRFLTAPETPPTPGAVVHALYELALGLHALDGGIVPELLRPRKAEGVNVPGLAAHELSLRELEAALIDYYRDELGLDRGKASRRLARELASRGIARSADALQEVYKVMTSQSGRRPKRALIEFKRPRTPEEASAYLTMLVAARGR